MRGMREKAVIKHEEQRCLIRQESKVITVKGFYPLVATKIKISVYTKVS